MLHNNEGEIIIINNETIDNSNFNFESGIFYHYQPYEGLWEDNILLIRNKDIVLDFQTSAHPKYYKGAISAYTYLDLLCGCIKNEFKDDMNEGKVDIEFVKDYGTPECISINTTITVHHDNDITKEDVMSLINRVVFLSVSFTVAEQIYNEEVKKAADSARLVKVAEPKKI